MAPKWVCFSLFQLRILHDLTASNRCPDPKVGKKTYWIRVRTRGWNGRQCGQSHLSGTSIWSELHRALVRLADAVLSYSSRDLAQSQCKLRLDLLGALRLLQARGLVILRQACKGLSPRRPRSSLLRSEIELALEPQTRQALATLKLP